MIGFVMGILMMWSAGVSGWGLWRVGGFLAVGMLLVPAVAAGEEAADVRRVAGYRGIWFDLGQRSEYGSKYSGGLGTYTAKHHPMAVHVEDVGKTFFVYGGTTTADERHLLAMVSAYDHRTGTLPRPVVVHDKGGVDDPHDNPSLNLDGDGHLWVFVSGRGRARPGFKYRSRQPHDIGGFDLVAEEEFTYPQPWWVNGSGFVHLFTRYTDGRELYWNTSDPEASSWSDPQKLAGMGGHYQMSNERDGVVITAFNRHPDGNVDRRTDLYFLQTKDAGATWQTAAGETVATPLADPQSPALVRAYSAENRLVYLKDIGFDHDGSPVLLYLTSAHHQPGPMGDPRTWTIARWKADRWEYDDVARSDHNYDMGSLYIEDEGRWRIIAPIRPGPQPHGTGGEMVALSSDDHGRTWTEARALTSSSPRNHAYARRPRHAHPDFYAFWADGNPDEMSPSFLYFTNRDGNKVRRMPAQMEGGTAAPEMMDE